MKFRVIKSSPDGMTSPPSCFNTIEEVLREIRHHTGWSSLEELHAGIRAWAVKCGPGDAYCTQVSAVVAVQFPLVDDFDDTCFECDHNGLDYNEPEVRDGFVVEQEASCPSCGERRVDVFTLSERKKVD